VAFATHADSRVIARLKDDIAAFVTVVEVVGATGMVVADCSVVVVLLILSGSPQLANKAVPPMSPTPSVT